MLDEAHVASAQRLVVLTGLPQDEQAVCSRRIVAEEEEGLPADRAAAGLAGAGRPVELDCALQRSYLAAVLVCFCPSPPVRVSAKERPMNDRSRARRPALARASAYLLSSNVRMVLAGVVAVG